MSPTRSHLAAMVLAATPFAAHAQTPWEDHGALRVSANGRQLQHADGTPFFYLGDTAWEIGTRMEFDAQAGGRGIEYYLNNRAAKGFNVIQAPIIAPLTGLGNNVEGQRITGGGAFNPDSLNESYLARFDRIIDEAAERGMYVALLPTWGSLVSSGTININNAERYGEVIGARYADRDNIIWTLGGDIAPGWENVWNALAKGVANGVNGAAGSTTPDYSTVLMTFHPAGGRSSSQFSNLGSWMDFNSLQTSHSDPKVPESATYNRHFDRPAADYAVNPPKPMINTEPPYENITIGLSSDPAAPRHGTYELRLAGYWSVIGGAAGHAYGHNNVWQAHDFNHGYAAQFGANDEWEDSLDTPGAAEASLMKNLMLSRPFTELVRDNSVLANYGALAAGKTVSSSVASRGDDYAMAYSGDGSTFNVAMGKIAGANVKAWWFNPRTGDAIEIGVFANAGTRTFDAPGTPGYGNDWVLVLSDVLADHPTPGQTMDQAAFRTLHEDFVYQHRFNNASTNGAATINTAGPGVTFNSGLASGSQRAVLVSHRADFNFFEQALDIRLDGIAITGDAGGGGNSLFLAIGDGNGNEKALYPGADLNHGLSFEIRKGATGVQLAFLEVVDRVNSNEYYALEAMPTDVRILLDGENQTWKVILTGDGFAGGQRIIEGDWARLLTSDPAFYKLALGAYNAGAVGSNTIASLNELIVTAVPEPASVALLGAGALLAARRRRA